MTLRDWRDAPAGEVASLYEAERTRWSKALHWDLAPSWAVVEEARAAGRLPGLIVRDAAGRAVGWTFFLIHQQALQVGALNARSAAAARTLLDGILESPEAAIARRCAVFIWPESPAIASALTRRRFDVRRHLYLERPLGRDVFPYSGDASLDNWHEDDQPEAVRLLAAAYAGERAAECFAPSGRLDEWAHYLGQLLRTPACGVFLPAASYTARRAGRLVGLALVARLGPEAAHLVQLAVDPSERGRGLGPALVQAACVAARERGAARVTLLVEEGAAAARALYARLQFAQRAEFLFAVRTRPLSRRSAGRGRQPSAAA
jgi:ribosomal protein S18 acetylase RimI-like enzyme